MTTPTYPCRTCGSTHPPFVYDPRDYAFCPGNETDTDAELRRLLSEAFSSIAVARIQRDPVQLSIDAEITAAGYDPVTLEPTICFYD